MTTETIGVYEVAFREWLVLIQPEDLIEFSKMIIRRHEVFNMN